MLSKPPASAKTVVAEVSITLGDRRLDAKVSAPAGPTRLVDLLPLAHQLAGAVVGAAVEDAVAAGETISCKKGCGACCRQLVPISQVEARRLAQLVEELPEPRRAQVRARFAEGLKSLEEAGLLNKLRAREHWDPDGAELDRTGLEYFRLGISCPFLEEESCSIHPDRPVTCREYLVTSPAEHCARPTRENINTVRIPLKVWPALAKFDHMTPGGRFVRWVPLILILDWALENPDEPPPRPGGELLKEMIEHLTGQSLPAPPVGLG